MAPHDEVDLGRAGDDGPPFRERMSTVWEVSSLVAAVAQTLQSRFGVVTVRGELSGVTRAASGHLYFTVKAPDGSASLRCAMFRRSASLLDFAPAQGMEVLLRGRITLYEPRGELQLVVEGMQRAGAGALMEEFLRLKARLEAEGLFDPARKRALATHPSRVAVVTSPAAAAWRDVMTALARRSPHVEVWLVPSPVQGADAPPALVAALRLAATLPVDTLLVCRGGGSIEDLWAFNDERVVRAVAASPVPVVSGVGHETDFTLTDFVADVRAPTPTAAAEMAAPRGDQLARELDGLQDALQVRVHRRLDRDMQRLDRLASRLARPAQVVHAHHRRLATLVQRMDAAWPQWRQQQEHRLQTLEQRLSQAIRRRLEQSGQRLALLSARLSAMDPDLVLQRGYARLSLPDGTPLTSVKQARVRQPLQARLADGTLDLTVKARTADPA